MNNDIDSNALQRDLDQLVRWEQKWQLHFNADKCKVMHLRGDKNLHKQYVMKSTILEETIEKKTLEFGFGFTQIHKSCGSRSMQS